MSLSDNRIHGRSAPTFANETALKIPFKAPASCSAHWDDTAWINHTLATALRMEKRAVVRTILLSRKYQARVYFPSVESSAIRLRKAQS